MSNSLQPHGLQHARLPCPSLSSRVCSNSCTLSWWCYPTISSSVIPFFCLQSFPASGSFPMSQLFASGGQSIVTSASVLPMNIQGWFSLGWISLVSLQSKGLSRVFSSTTVRKHQSLSKTYQLLPKRIKNLYCAPNLISGPSPPCSLCFYHKGLLVPKISSKAFLPGLHLQLNPTLGLPNPWVCWGSLICTLPPSSLG